MTCEEFLRNNRGINNGENLPPDFLQAIYASIVRNEIRTSSEAESGAFEARDADLDPDPDPDPAPAPDPLVRYYPRVQYNCSKITMAAGHRGRHAWRVAIAMP